jgi:hypothetical protein
MLGGVDIPASYPYNNRPMRKDSKCYSTLDPQELPMRRLKAILIEEGLLGRGRRASTRIDRERVDHVVRMFLKDPYEHLDGGVIVELLFDEAEEEWESDPGNPSSRSSSFDFFVPSEGTFENGLIFSAKVLEDYPELLDREFMEEVLQGVLRKMGPKDFLEASCDGSSLDDGGHVAKENAYATLEIKKYTEVHGVTNLRVLKDPYTLHDGKAYANFGFEATFEVKYEVTDFDFDGYYDPY